MTRHQLGVAGDLSGQVCADSIGTRLYSGVGGQMDFMRGAALSPGGKAIIALPSTAKAGRLSRIAPVLSRRRGRHDDARATSSTLSPNTARRNLHGKSIRERAALIGIAHPGGLHGLARWAHEQRLL